MLEFTIRAGRPILEANCAALGLALPESAMFGHEEGAFTGAVARRKGRAERSSCSCPATWRHG